MRTKTSEQEDYLLRMIQEIGRAMARLRRMLSESESAGPTVRAEVSSSTQRLLGADVMILERLDAVSAAQLISSPSRIALWAQLLDVEAESWTHEGNAERAGSVTARAAALRAAAASLSE